MCGSLGKKLYLDVRVVVDELRRDVLTAAGDGARVVVALPAPGGHVSVEAGGCSVRHARRPLRSRRISLETINKSVYREPFSLDET